jgi:hypothetical protein
LDKLPPRVVSAVNFVQTLRKSWLRQSHKLNECELRVFGQRVQIARSDEIKVFHVALAFVPTRFSGIYKPKYG